MLTDFQLSINDKYGRYTVREDKEFNKNFCSASLKRMEMRSYQKFVVDYMKNETNENIRGLLLVHGLGSGKTYTSTGVMSGLEMETVVLLPASLRDNFDYFVRRFYRGGKRVSYMAYNASNLRDQYKKLARLTLAHQSRNYFDNKLVIVDECHLFFQNVISGKAKQAIDIYTLMVRARGAKFLLLTGTPISGDPFELAPLFNLLRGPLHGLPLFPIDYEVFRDNFVSTEFNSIKNKEVFQDRIAGLVSFYRGVKDPEKYILPEKLPIDVVHCPMGNIQWTSYIRARTTEWDFERKSKYSRDKFRLEQYKKAARASVGTYKINSAQVCNFAFPTEIEKKFEAIKIRGGEISEIKWGLLEQSGPGALSKIYNNLAAHSSKLAKLLENVTKTSSRSRKLFVFTRFKVLGSRIIGEMLKKSGYEEVNEDSIRDPREDRIPQRRAFMIINGDTKDKDKMIQVFNRPDNAHGELCQILVGTTVVSAGVSLNNVREIHVFDPQWRFGTIEQVIGRGIRTCSHSRLPIEDRDVKTYIYLSTAPSAKAKASIDIDSGLTTDEILYQLSLTRDKLNDTFVLAIKEAAVDCKLNVYDNSTPENPIECRYCINDPPTLLFPANWKQHIAEGSKCVYKEMTVQLVDFYHDGTKYKRDIADNIYEWNESMKSYEEVGYISDGRLVRVDTDLAA